MLNTAFQRAPSPGTPGDGNTLYPREQTVFSSVEITYNWYGVIEWARKIIVNVVNWQLLVFLIVSGQQSYQQSCMYVSLLIMLM